eukprot:IDg12876t1
MTPKWVDGVVVLVAMIVVNEILIFVMLGRAVAALLGFAAESRAFQKAVHLKLSERCLILWDFPGDGNEYPYSCNALLGRHVMRIEILERGIAKIAKRGAATFHLCMASKDEVKVKGAPEYLT